MNMVDNEVNDVSVCANCGKDGAKNICNKCNMLKYCNAVCKKKHKKKHKKDCEEHVRLATEKHNEGLRIAAELHDEKLFKQPPPKEDCPICFLRMPTYYTGWSYNTCCGKSICRGCIHAPLYDDQGNKVDIEKQNECPFCRTPGVRSVQEAMERLKKRAEGGDPMAICNLGNYYKEGTYGFPQDSAKALEHWHRASELGYAGAYCNIGLAYENGDDIDVDMKKAVYYYELSAIGGNELARYYLGNLEVKSGNVERALRHYMIAVRSGYSDSLQNIKWLYSNGHITKGVYTKALQAHQEYLVEIKSKNRDEAAAARASNRYY